MIKIKQSLLMLFVFLLFACNYSVAPQDSFTGPSNLSITKVDWGCLKLSWTDNTNREMQYQIDRRVGDGEWEIKFWSVDV